MEGLLSTGPTPSSLEYILLSQTRKYPNLQKIVDIVIYFVKFKFLFHWYYNFEKQIMAKDQITRNNHDLGTGYATGLFMFLLFHQLFVAVNHSVSFNFPVQEGTGPSMT